jgi:hypothetical protein
MGYAGKVVGGMLSSTSAAEVADAFKLTRDGLKDMPYLTKDIGYNAGKGFDYISTSHELLNNAFWSATGCYGSFSWPCSTS